MTYAQLDELVRRMVVAIADGIKHHKMLNDLSNMDLLFIDESLTVGSVPEAVKGLFAVLAYREHQLLTMTGAQFRPFYWAKYSAEALPERLTADSIGNRLANKAREVCFSDTDMCGRPDDQARVAAGYLE